MIDRITYKEFIEIPVTCISFHKKHANAIYNLIKRRRYQVLPRIVNTNHDKVYRLSGGYFVQNIDKDYRILVFPQFDWESTESGRNVTFIDRKMRNFEDTHFNIGSLKRILSIVDQIGLNRECSLDSNAMNGFESHRTTNISLSKTDEQANSGEEGISSHKEESECFECSNSMNYFNCLLKIKTMSLPIRTIMNHHTLQPISRFIFIANNCQLTFNIKNYTYSRFISNLFYIKFKQTKCILAKLLCLRPGYSPFKFKNLIGNFNEVVYKENKTQFLVNYRIMYIEYRLTNERRHLCDSLRRSYGVCDVHANFGLFTRILAKYGVRMFSNTDDPHYFLYLQKNVEKYHNKNVFLFNREAPSFINYILLFKNVEHFVFFDPERSLKDVLALKYTRRRYTLHMYFFCKYYVDVIEFLNEILWFEVHESNVRRLGVTTSSRVLYKLTRFVDKNIHGESVKEKWVSLV